jgi:thiamine biosynthesis protein ThiI
MSTDRGVILKVGELFLKAGTRHRFMRQLRDNVRRVLSAFPEARVEKPYGVVLVRLKHEVVDERYEALLQALGRVFGVARVLPCRLVEPVLADVLAAAVAEADEAVARAGRDDLAFRLTVKRADKRFRPDSRGLIDELATAVCTRYPAFHVNLTAFDLNLAVEVREEVAYVYSRELKGAGGLPVGSSGSLTLLLSGGIDSPVAGWYGLKRGCHVRGVYFDSFPLIGREARAKVQKLAALLARWQGSFHLTVVPFADVQKLLKKEAPLRELVLLYRRSMYRLADRHRREQGAEALLTGDNLGQVASQTLPNLKCLDDAVETMVVRPLIGFDKNETSALSRTLGFFDVSTEAAEDACALFMPLHPQLTGKPEFLRGVEERVGEALTKAEEDAWARREEHVFEAAP